MMMTATKLSTDAIPFNNLGELANDQGITLLAYAPFGLILAVFTAIIINNVITNRDSNWEEQADNFPG